MILNLKLDEENYDEKDKNNNQIININQLNEKDNRFNNIYMNKKEEFNQSQYKFNGKINQNNN